MLRCIASAAVPVKPAESAHLASCLACFAAFAVLDNREAMGDAQPETRVLLLGSDDEERSSPGVKDTAHRLRRRGLGMLGGAMDEARAAKAKLVSIPLGTGDISDIVKRRFKHGQPPEADEALTTDQLIAMGLSVYDIAQAMFNKIPEQGRVNYFPHVNLDTEGGLPLIRKVWTGQKHFWCALAVGTAVFNVLVLLSLNYSVLVCLLDSAQVMWDTGSMTAGVQQETSAAIASKNSNFKMLSNIRNVGTKKEFIILASAVGALESAGVIVLLLRMMQLVATFLLNGGICSKSEFVAYTAMDKLNRIYLPLLGTFSALKLAVYVHPSLVFNDLSMELQDATICGKPARQRTGGIAFVATKFVLIRLVFLFGALGAFGMKCVIIAWKLTHPNVDFGWQAWLAAFAFLNCCIGTVTLEQQLQDRIFLFIFGGEDSQYQPDELAMVNVYRANAMKKIWTEFWEKGERLNAISFMLTLDNFDLQAMLIEPSNLEICREVHLGMSAVKEVNPDAVEQPAAQAEAAPVATEQPEGAAGEQSKPEEAPKED